MRGEDPLELRISSSALIPLSDVVHLFLQNAQITVLARSGKYRAFGVGTPLVASVDKSRCLRSEPT